MEAHAVDGRTQELLRHLQTRKRLLVLTHATPDPDSLASAMGLRHLAETKVGLPSTFGYSGQIMRAENKEMVRSCEIEMIPQEELDVDAYDCLALVDTQPGFGHTHLPEGRDIDIVIDHHVSPESPLRPTPPAFSDVRTYVGATSSMVAGYLLDAGSTSRRASRRRCTTGSRPIRLTCLATPARSTSASTSTWSAGSTARPWRGSPSPI